MMLTIREYQKRNLYMWFPNLCHTEQKNLAYSVHIHAYESMTHGMFDDGIAEETVPVAVVFW